MAYTTWVWDFSGNKKFKPMEILLSIIIHLNIMYATHSDTYNNNDPQITGTTIIDKNQE